MTNKRIVLRKLETLNEHRQRLRHRLLKRTQAAAMQQDLDDAINMSLLVCTQEVVDISSHIATDDGLGTPESAAAAILTLARHNILSEDLARRLAALVSLRNRIAHGYSEIDTERVSLELPSGLQAMDRFVEAVLRYLGSAAES